jgi:hypothetical protein
MTGDQQLVSHQAVPKTPLSLAKLYGCPQGRRSGGGQVFLLILKLARKSAKSLSTNPEKNSAELQNTNLLHPAAFLTASRLTGDSLNFKNTKA